MAAMIYDAAAGAWREAETPLIWDAEAQAYKDSTGLVWDEQAGAWREVWSAAADMPDNIWCVTKSGCTGSVSSDYVDISKFKTLSGCWEVHWYENSQYYPNYQQGYGQIVADNTILFTTGNCTYSNQDGGIIGTTASSHYKQGTFAIDIANYESLHIAAVATKSYSNWYHRFTIYELKWS